MIFPALLAFAVWYLYFGTEYALNGGALGRNQWLMPFQCFWEEVLWNIPGGLKRKTAYVRENIVGKFNGSVLGSRRSWNYSEVREQNLYEACARDVLGGPVGFWLTTTIVPLVGFAIGLGLQRGFSVALWLLT